MSSRNCCRSSSSNLPSKLQNNVKATNVSTVNVAMTSQQQIIVFGSARKKNVTFVLKLALKYTSSSHFSKTKTKKVQISVLWSVLQRAFWSSFDPWDEAVNWWTSGYDDCVSSSRVKITQKIIIYFMPSHYGLLFLYPFYIFVVH